MRPLPKTIEHRAENAGDKHVPAYLHEKAFRFNNRHSQYLFRPTLLELIRAGNQPCRELVQGK